MTKKPKRQKRDFAQIAHAVAEKAAGGSSKKLENHEHALALYFMYYNFCRIHQTLRMTPAMEAGVTDHVWSLDEVIG
jgi:hypothetical protein